jgi:Ca2+-binding RTX toxin-like protein
LAAVSLSLAAKGTRGDALGDTFDGIERVVGSDFADVIVGDSLDNELVGGAGNDLLRGGDGRDVLVGGAGADILRGGGDGDWVSYAGSTGAVFVDLASRAASGGDAAGDTFWGVANLAGGNGDDTLAGNNWANSLFGADGADLIRGRAGDDTIEGGGGADMMFGGGGGFDRLSYAGSTQGVTVDLGTGAASGGDANGDLYSGFEGLIGSAFADSLTGGAGDDTIEGGAGSDLLDGGGGIDTVSYAGLGGWVSVSLLSSTAYEYFSTSDTVLNFENVVGSAYGDAIYGNDLANAIDGGAGGDFIAGYGGDDLLTGGAGDDFFYIDHSSGSDRVLDFHAGDDMEDEVGLGLGFDFDSFSEVMAVATQLGADTILNFAPDTQLTLVGINVAALTATDFYFN